MLVAQNSLGPVCPVPLTVRGIRGARSFNQPLNKWNVSNVTNMRWVFSDATSFNQPLNNWNVSKVTDMGGMFAKALSFNQPLNNWDVSKVKYMYDMFYDASSFNQPLNNWNVSNDVTDMQLMFYNAEAVRCRRQHTPAILYVETAV